MKVTFNSKDILRHVQSVGSLIKTSSPMPILETVLFNFENDKLQLVAENLEVRSSLDVKVDFFGNYFTCIPYALLTTILKVFPDGPVEFEFSDKEVTLTSAAGGEYKIPLENGADFPKSKIEDAGEKLQYNSLDFVEAIKKALAFVGPDSIEWDSTVLIDISQEATQIVGGTRNSMYKETLDVKGSPNKLVLSRNTVSYLINSIHTEEVMEVTYTDNKVYFALEGRSISAIQKNISWPNYQALFEKNTAACDKTYKVDINSLVPPLQRLSSIAVNRSSAISLSFSTDKLQLSYNNTLLHYAAKETITIDFKGEPINTGFPADQLLNVLKFMDGETQVTMEMSEETKPCYIHQDSKQCIMSAVRPV